MLVGCEAPATHTAELVTYAVGVPIHAPAIGHINVRVCDAHATNEEGQLLLSDDGKRAIELAFAAQGLTRPDWSRSYIRWKKLEENAHDNHSTTS